MIRAARCEPAEVRHLLAAILKPQADSDGKLNVDALIAKGQAFSVKDEGGAVVAAYLLQPKGPDLWVTAFGGQAEFDLSYVAAELIEQQAGEFDAIAFRTERRGLVRKALRKGYRVVRQQGRAYYLKKELRQCPF